VRRRLDATADCDDDRVDDYGRRNGRRRSDYARAVRRGPWTAGARAGHDVLRPPDRRWQQLHNRATQRLRSEYPGHSALADRWHLADDDSRAGSRSTTGCLIATLSATGSPSLSQLTGSVGGIGKAGCGAADIVPPLPCCQASLFGGFGTGYDCPFGPASFCCGGPINQGVCCDSRIDICCGNGTDGFNCCVQGQSCRGAKKCCDQKTAQCCGGLSTGFANHCCDKKGMCCGNGCCDAGTLCTDAANSTCACNATSCPAGSCCDRSTGQCLSSADQSSGKCGTSGFCAPCPQDTACSIGGFLAGQCVCFEGARANQLPLNGVCPECDVRHSCPAGCCDANGDCQPGNSFAACGAVGSTCTICTPLLATCAVSGQFAGQCVCSFGSRAGQPPGTDGLCTQCDGQHPCTNGQHPCTNGGCCDAQGNCHQDGLTNVSACGPAGGTCSVCSGVQQCVNGTCQGCDANHPCPSGCCDAYGHCQPGDTRYQCGTGGGPCQICDGSSQAGCLAGTCVNPLCSSGNILYGCRVAGGFITEFCCPNNPDEDVCNGVCCERPCIVNPGFCANQDPRQNLHFCASGGCVPKGVEYCVSDSDCCGVTAPQTSAAPTVAGAPPAIPPARSAVSWRPAAPECAFPSTRQTRAVAGSARDAAYYSPPGAHLAFPPNPDRCHHALGRIRGPAASGHQPGQSIGSR